MADSELNGIAELLKNMDAKGLIDVFNDSKDSLTRMKAAKALGEIGDDKAISPLKRACLDENEDAEVKREAARALYKITLDMPLDEEMLSIGMIVSRILLSDSNG